MKKPGFECFPPVGNRAGKNHLPLPAARGTCSKAADFLTPLCIKKRPKLSLETVIIQL